MCLRSLAVRSEASMLLDGLVASVPAPPAASGKVAEKIMYKLFCDVEKMSRC